MTDTRERIEFGKKYQELGWAVQEQLDDLLDGNDEPGSLNDNAVDMIEQFAQDEGFDDLLRAVEQYRAATEREEAELAAN